MEKVAAAYHAAGDDERTPGMTKIGCVATERFAPLDRADRVCDVLERDAMELDDREPSAAARGLADST
jgi:hypothetical protein